MQSKLKDNDEVAHQQLPRTINFDIVTVQQVIMVSLPPTTISPDLPTFVIFPREVSSPKSFLFSKEKYAERERARLNR